MRTFKIYSLNNFHIHDTAMLTTVTMLNISFPGHVYFITGSLYLSTPFTRFTHSLSLSLGATNLLCPFFFLSFSLSLSIFGCVGSSLLRAAFL